MPLTKAKKYPQKISERRQEKDFGRIKEAEKRAEVFFSFFLRCEISFGKKRVSIIYFFNFNQLKLMYLCFIRIS